MNDRKQHVIKMAHQLFIERGFQNTSIQDILEYSGISKGTFYNYFSSKNELLIALFREIFKKINKERNELLIGQDRSNIDLFIKQLDLQLNTNNKNKLFTLFEEVLVSNDAELKQFMKEGQLKMLHWVFQRFLEIFGEEKKPYLLDCAIMFMGILHHNMKYYQMDHDLNTGVHEVVHYSVSRIKNIVEELAETGEQLNKPELLESLIPELRKSEPAFQEELSQVIGLLKKNVNGHKDQAKYAELLDFVRDEFLHGKDPRKFLIESTLFTLKKDHIHFEEDQLEKLERLVSRFFTERDGIEIK
ncbi:TetR family transcriptional regulator [Bacillus sp. SA1-12]|uniref:TetR family transcriptional regulator n=1 Tax=Bacillus sp. SA1-12 TaxID=1455638 RepID=UPI000626FC1F|nr:TetR family transcriptional regulator [Bacillus sp. SA1-12]KKI90450.1 TetR family transcriptional regulator [Bacillus sp. SA1-12]